MKENSIYISVVIPLYNKQNSITATLQSVLAQTYQNFEIVVVDDGSTDNSAQVVEDFILASRLSGVPDKVHDFVGCSSPLAFRLIRKPNGGVSSARNEGIRQAKYNYIAFLDADDYWEPTYLETQAKMIQNFPDAKMWGTAFGMMEKGIKVERKATRISPDFCGIVDNNLYFARNQHLYCTDVVVLDKRIFKHIPMFDERVICGEDVDMWWRIIAEYPIAFVNECLAYYKQDAENRITLSSPKLDKHFVYYLEKYDKLYDKCPEFKRYIQHEILGHLYKYFRVNPNNKEIKRILSQIDFSLQPFSYRLRYTTPKLYEFLMKLKKHL